MSDLKHLLKAQWIIPSAPTPFLFQSLLAQKFITVTDKSIHLSSEMKRLICVCVVQQLALSSDLSPIDVGRTFDVASSGSFMQERSLFY